MLLSCRCLCCAVAYIWRYIIIWTAFPIHTTVDNSSQMAITEIAMSTAVYSRGMWRRRMERMWRREVWRKWMWGERMQKEKNAKKKNQRRTMQRRRMWRIWRRRTQTRRMQTWRSKWSRPLLNLEPWLGYNTRQNAQGVLKISTISYPISCLTRSKSINIWRRNICLKGKFFQKELRECI